MYLFAISPSSLSLSAISPSSLSLFAISPSSLSLFAISPSSTLVPVRYQPLLNPSPHQNDPRHSPHPLLTTYSILQCLFSPTPKPSGLLHLFAWVSLRRLPNCLITVRGKLVSSHRALQIPSLKPQTTSTAVHQ
jgi:hypothetical protein